MCFGQVDLADYLGSGVNFEDSFDTLQGLASDGVVTLDGSRIAVTEAGRSLARVVAAAFDSYLQAGTGRHSVAV